MAAVTERADDLPLATRRPSLFRAVLSTTEGRLAAVLAVLLGALIVIGPFVAHPTGLGDSTPALPPSMAHPLGTDALGRDVWSRLLKGGTTVLLIPMVAVVLATGLGGALGLTSAYVGGRLDLFLTKVFDIMLSLPPLLVVLVVIAGFGPTDKVLIVTVCLVFAPSFGRVARGATQTIVVNLYVAAARARGESGRAIILREILPNVTAPLLAEFGLRMTYGILFVAGLSFLGLGVQPPQPDWGLMVAENRSILAVSPLASLAPALAVTGIAVCFNLFADALTKCLGGDDSGRVADV